MAAKIICGVIIFILLCTLVSNCSSYYYYSTPGYSTPSRGRSSYGTFRGGGPGYGK